MPSQKLLSPAAWMALLALGGLVVAWHGLGPGPPVAGPVERPSVRVPLPAPAKKFRENKDLREAPAAAGEIASRREAAAAALKELVPGLQIDFDDVTGGPKHLMATGRLLTAATQGSSGERVVADFIDAHRDLFGHDSTALEAGHSRLTRDDLSAHNGMHTVVWQQELEGVPLFQTVLRANLTRDLQLITLGGNYLGDPAAATGVTPAQRAALVAAPPIPPSRAVVLAAAELETAVEESSVKARDDPQGAERKQSFAAPGLGDLRTALTWAPTGPASARLAWDVILTRLAPGEMFRVLVDAQNGEVLVRHSLTDDLSPASYRVFARGDGDGSGQPYDSPTPLSPGRASPLATQPPAVARELVTLDALDPTASPRGWIDDGGTQTLGNNVDAHTDSDGSPDVPDLPRPTSATRVFDFPFDPAKVPGASKDAAVVQLFYLNNWIHDQLYRLGFTETAGNFQTDNFGRGGLGNDAVLADAQDGSGTNNANFSTPPDGSPGRMQMYLFTGPTPDVDGDLDAEIVLHEYVHGLSNRLVGGGVGISASQTQGMGEGWSDFYALALLSEPGDDIHGNYAAGAYVARLFSGLAENYYFGIRRYPYSTNLAVNPLTFRDIDPTQAGSHSGVPRSAIIGGAANEVHNAGEVWCVTLWEMRANLIARHGATTGNTLALQLVTDGMKLCPVNPTFLQARDAILQADLVDTGGANRSELWRAFAKRGMGASASAPASGATSGLVEAYDFPDDLSVSPLGAFEATGPVGGPLSPTSWTFTLRNNGSTALDWTAARDQPWLTLSTTSGSLSPGDSRTVTATLSSAAASLPPGVYADTIVFRNTATGALLTRPVTLTIEPLYLPLFSDSFESDTLASAWTLSGTGPYRTRIAQANGPHAGTRHLTMDSSIDSTYARNEATLTLDLAGRKNLVLSFWVKMFNDEDNAPATNPFTGGADFDGVAVSADGGTTWYEVQELRSIGAAWQKISVDLDGAIASRGLSYTSPFKIRFNHYDNFGITTDGFAFDDILVAETASQSLVITAADSAREGDGPVPAVLTVTPPPGQPLTVSLSSSSDEAAVPASVTIPAGGGSATFAITPADDALLDGSQSVTLTATAPSFPETRRIFTVHDNETATLTLDVPDSVIEGSSPPTGMVTVSAPVGRDVTVTLTSDSPSVKLPADVTLPAGSSSAPFSILLVNDDQINGSRSASITASVAGWTSGSETMTILDDETRALALTLPASLREGDTGRTATLRLSGSLPANLEVALTGSDPSELGVPATVTIPAGQTRVEIPLTVIDDTEADGPQPFVLTASAAGFTQATAAGTVLDDDAHHFSISPIAGPVLRNQAVDIAITARDAAGGIIADYAQKLSFRAEDASAIEIPVTPAMASGFVNGTLRVNPAFGRYGTGVVLTASDTGGRRSASNAFDVTVGPMARLAWSGIIPYVQKLDTPFQATVRALDAAGNPVTSFHQPLSFSALLPDTGEILPIRPAAPVSFTAGEWTGALSVPFPGSALTLRATAGTYLTDTNPFSVVAPVYSASTIFAEDFETGFLDPAFWTLTGTGNARTEIISHDAPHGGGWHLAMDSSAGYARNEATLTLDLSGRSAVTLRFWAAGRGDEAHGPPAGPFSGGADFDGVAVSEDGLTWWEVQGLRPLNASDTQYVLNLDSAIAAHGLRYGPAFRIRFNHYDDGPLGSDGMVLDDILISAPPAASDLKLTLPAQITEGAGDIRATLSVATGPLTDLPVTLRAIPPDKLSIPPQVIIPAGATSVEVILSAPDDLFLDGEKSITVTATASGHSTTSVTTRITDNDSPAHLAIEPTGPIEASGPAGGPFQVTPQDFLLANTGGQALSWTATGDTPWLRADPSGGDLAPGASVIVSAGISAPFTDLAPGVFNASLHFTTTSYDAISTSLPISLQILPTQDTDGDKLPDSWENSYGLQPTDNGALDPRQGQDGDPDGDGISNLLEYAFGLNPVIRNSSGLPTARLAIDPSDGKTHLTFQYRRRIVRRNLQYQVETADSLTASAWSATPPAGFQEISTQPTGDGITELCTVRIDPPVDVAPRKFVRLRVSAN